MLATIINTLSFGALKTIARRKEVVILATFERRNVDRADVHFTRNIFCIIKEVVPLEMYRFLTNFDVCMKR